MASAAITVNEMPARIECDTDAAVITKGSVLTEGYIANAGTVKAFLIVNGLGASIQTDSGQDADQVDLPAGASFPVLKHYMTIAHKTAAGVTVLQWFPTFVGRG